MVSELAANSDTSSSKSPLAAGCLALVIAACGPIDAELGAGTDFLSGSCSVLTTPIARVQGTSALSPFLDERVDVTGVVTLPLPGLGFYVQSETPDGDPESSEALFVRSASAKVSRAQRVRVRGRVREQSGVTELDSVELVQVCGAADLRPTEAALSDGVEPERWENMWVTSRESWTLVDSSRLAHSELTISGAGRLYAAGHELGAPGANASSPTWRLRSAESHTANVAPFARPRLGAEARELTGIVQLAGSGPALLLTGASSWRLPSAPAPLPPSTSTLRVAALNLDNYFAELGGLGAASELELLRQRDKLVAALVGLHADILAVVEVGNSALSLAHLMAGLDASLDTGQRYAVSPMAPPAGATLRAGILYRPGRVEAVGEAWFELAPEFRRPPLFQKFRSAHQELTLGVVHLKSKRCDGEPTASDLDGCGADVRQAEAARLVRVCAELERAGSEHLLLVGDFNADQHESPLVTLRRAGLVELLESITPAERYSYVYDGRASLLDHALASGPLARKATSAGIWHINADEPSSRGYSLDNPPSEYQPDALRSSDHDPVSVDFSP